MITWNVGPLLVFDLETTAPDPLEARIVTHAMAFHHADDRVEDVATGIVNPGMPIPPEAIAVHGITDEVAAERGTSLRVALTALSRGFALAIASRAPIVAFNASYDLTVTRCELDRAERTGELEPDVAARIRAQLRALRVIDPLVIDKRVEKYRKGSRRLADVCARYGLRLENAHEATADALAAGMLARAVAAHYPAIAKMSVAELHIAQAGWAAEQAASLRDYFAKIGKHDAAKSVNGAWPIR